MNFDSVELKLSRNTAEQLYTFLYNSEKRLTQDLILLLDRMEKEHFSSYTIEKMEDLTSGENS